MTDRTDEDVDEGTHGEESRDAPPSSLAFHLARLDAEHPRATVIYGKGDARIEGFPRVILAALSVADPEALDEPMVRIDSETLCLLCAVRYGFPVHPARVLAVWTIDPVQTFNE